MDRRHLPFAWYISGVPAVLFGLMCVGPATADQRRGTPAIPGGLKAFPLIFEAKQVQAGGKVTFLGRGRGYSLYLSPGEAVLAVSAAFPAVRMKLVGANRRVSMEGIDPVPGRANYFLGSNPRQWRTGIPMFARVVSRQVYPGIDQVYYGNQQQLEFDFQVAPGADPGRIRLSYSGIQGMRIDVSGDLVLSTEAGELRQRKPKIYQVKDGSTVEVAGSYRRCPGNAVGFTVGPYDTRMPLVIDPALTFATYLGGNGAERTSGIAVDASGNLYLAGRTESSDFPVTAGVVSRTNRGLGDIFVSKFTGAGALVYSTYVGGSFDDDAYGLAVDPAGNAYITGRTSSTDFPTVNAFQASNRGGLSQPYDAFVVKLAPGGSQLIYSTYLGGTVEEIGLSIAADGEGNAFVAGYTGSGNFPTTASAYQTAKLGVAAGFVTKLDPSGSKLIYSSFIGGSLADVASAVAVDSAGNAYVAGQSMSHDFPTTSGALQTQYRGKTDSFLVKLNPAGSAAVWSTFLGGTDEDGPNACAVDALGNVYLAGYTYSADLPVTANALQKTLKGPYDTDAFLSKIDPSGTSLVYSTYLGGTYSEEAFGVSVDAAGNAYLAGYTASTDFPVAAPLQAVLRGPTDCFVAKVDTVGGSLAQATYLGGSENENLCRIVTGAADTAYVAGATNSDDFPVTRDAFQTTFRQSPNEAFLAKLDFSPAARLGFAPASLDFLAAAGSSMPSKTLALTIPTGARPDWAFEATTSSGGNWLSVSQQSGTGSSTIQVTAATGTTPGTYYGTVTFTDPGSVARRAVIPVRRRLVETATSVSAASFAPGGALAPESIASAFGQRLVSYTEVAPSQPLPTTLAWTNVVVMDSARIIRPAPLFFVSPTQINYIVPTGSATGPATVTVRNSVAGESVAIGGVEIAAVAPGLFAVNQNGKGVAAALAVRAKADGSQSWQLVYLQGCTPGSCAATPIDLGPETDQVFLQLYGTGIRGRSSLAAVTAKLGGADARVDYAGPVAGLAGLDQVNLLIPRTLIGRGDVDIVLTVDGRTANTVAVNIK
jgi:uncharacterized protein (TIGR03437 family)